MKDALASMDIRPGGRLRILWLTNMAAPYRVPVWTTLADRHELRVGLLESNKSLASDSKANRGRDWLHKTAPRFGYLEIPTWKIVRGEARYYFLRNLSPIREIRRSDVVLFGGWESPAYWTMLILTIFFGVGRVAFYESPINTMRHRAGPVAWVRAAFFHSMHAIVTPGPAASDSLKAMGIPTVKIVQGFNAVDVDAFHSAATKNAGNIDLTKRPAGHSFLYVGQLISRKRVDAIVAAFERIASPQDQLTIVGSGPLEPQLRGLAANKNCRIAFLPVVDNSSLPAIMAQNQTLVLASSAEVWGLVVNEALASGMHVVVSTNCGVAPSVAGMPGIYFAQPDLSDLAGQMGASRDAWADRIPNPPILRHTPERFADDFDDAFYKAKPTLSRSRESQ